MQLTGMDKLFHLEGGRDAKRTIISIQKAGLNGQMFHKEVDEVTSAQQSQFTGLGVARWAVVPQKDVKHTAAPFSRKTRGKRFSGVADCNAKLKPIQETGSKGPLIQKVRGGGGTGEGLGYPVGEREELRPWPNFLNPEKVARRLHDSIGGGEVRASTVGREVRQQGKNKGKGEHHGQVAGVPEQIEDHGGEGKPVVVTNWSLAGRRKRR